MTVSIPTGPSAFSFWYSFLGHSTSTPRDVKELPSNGQSDSTKQRTPWWVTDQVLPFYGGDQLLRTQKRTRHGEGESQAIPSAPAAF